MGCGVALTGGGVEEISQEQSTLGQPAYLLVHLQVITFPELTYQEKSTLAPSQGLTFSSAR